MAEIAVPLWVRDAVFYQIFPDRFARSPQVPKPSKLEAWDAAPTTLGFKGGDLLGVVDQLDYLVDLGVNAVYFTPIFQSAANHRYHTHDYFRVDPLLGGDAALRARLEEAQAGGDMTITGVNGGNAVGLIAAVEPAGAIVRRIVAEAEQTLRGRPGHVLAR